MHMMYNYKYHNYIIIQMSIYTIASLLARKRDQPYSHMYDWLDQMPAGFSLLRSSTTCLRGTRSTAGFVPSPTYPDALDLTISEGQVPVS